MNQGCILEHLVTIYSKNKKTGNISGTMGYFSGIQNIVLDKFNALLSGRKTIMFVAAEGFVEIAGVLISCGIREKSKEALYKLWAVRDFRVPRRS
jgi:hypothetical protein